MEKRISVVIPNYNNGYTIEKCLESVFSSTYSNYEVIVVDDRSDDNSVEIIRRFPCKLIRLDHHTGASGARNRGGLSSSGELIFFTDADCVFYKDTLSIINRTVNAGDPDVVTGGTYSRMPYDKGFFNAFQAVFVYYSETKNIVSPDYIAAHAMVINTETFRKSKGFPEVFLPIIEDIEFTHRLKNSGYRLVMNPEIQVRHIFNFSLYRSLMNSITKSKYWTIYSLKNRNALIDSGCASTELKTNVTSGFMIFLLLALWIVFNNPLFLLLCPVFFAGNIYINRKLLAAFYREGGFVFGGVASFYYTMLYSISVGTGAAIGMLKYFLNGKAW